MKNAIVLGMLAFALLIGGAAAVAGSSLNIGTDEQADAAGASCPDGVDTSGMFTLPAGDICGMTDIPAEPGYILNLEIENYNEDFDYQWTVWEGAIGSGVQVFPEVGDPEYGGQVLDWTVPVVEDPTVYTVALTVSNPADPVACSAECSFTILVDPTYCCNDKDQDMCETELPEGWGDCYFYGPCCPVNGMWFEWTLYDPCGNVNGQLAGPAEGLESVFVNWQAALDLSTCENKYNGVWRVVLKITNADPNSNTEDLAEAICESTMVIYEYPDTPVVTVTAENCPTI